MLTGQMEFFPGVFGLDPTLRFCLFPSVQIPPLSGS